MKRGWLAGAVVLGALFYFSINAGAAVQVFAGYTTIENTSYGASAAPIITGDSLITFPASNPDRWTWCHVRLTGVRKKTCTLVFTYSRAEVYSTIQYRTPVIYYQPGTDDNAIGYEFCKQYAADTSSGSATTYRFTHTFKHDTAFVAYGPVHTNAQVTSFINAVKSSPYVVKLDTVGWSHIFQKRIVALHITDPAVHDTLKQGVWLLGREDAYETGGSLALMGALRFVLSNDPVAAALRRKYIFWVLPIFSQDGVHMGHTNYPINFGDYIYVTACWKDTANYPEVRDVRRAMARWKESGRSIVLSHSFHSASYWRSYLRPQYTTLTTERTRLYDTVLRGSYMYHYNNIGVTLNDTRFSYCIYQLFPAALTASSHSEFVIFPDVLGNGFPVHRTNECNYQDGELYLRGWADYAGIPNPQQAPPFLIGGEVLKNNAREGENVTYRVLYRDLLGQAPQQIRVVIDGTAYAMTKAWGTDYAKGVFYTYTAPLTSDVNGFYFTATNAVGTRRVPSVVEFPGPFLYPEPPVKITPPVLQDGVPPGGVYRQPNPYVGGGNGPAKNVQIYRVTGRAWQPVSGGMDDQSSGVYITASREGRQIQYRKIVRIRP
jgi:hypothetical protein